MRDKQKTREGMRLFTGSETENLEKSCWGEDTAFPCSYQGKCARCPYSPGRGMACNLESCPFSSSGRCKDCAHLLPLDEHRRKARCRWTGERLASGGVERVRDCIGFEKKAGEGLTSAGVYGNLASPNLTRRNKRLSSLPRAGKSLVRISAVEAPIMSNGRLSHIGGVQRPSTVRLGGFVRAGERCCPASFFTPKSNEVPHD